MRLFGNVDGTIDRVDRAAWLSGIFDRAFGRRLVLSLATAALVDLSMAPLALADLTITPAALADLVLVTEAV